MMNDMRYGWCVGCVRWVPRDEMLSFNTEVYDAQNRVEKIRQRYCPICAADERARLMQRRWDHVLVHDESLAPLPDGSMPSRAQVWEREKKLREDQNAREIDDSVSGNVRVAIDVADDGYVCEEV